MSKRTYFYLLLTVLLLIPAVSFGSNTGKIEDKVKAKLVSLSIPFIENTGQIENDEVSFYAKTFGGTVFITKEGDIVYSLPKFPDESNDSLRNKKANKNVISKDIYEDIKKLPIKGIALKEKLFGANIKEIKGEERAVTKVSYFIGNDPSKWKNNISTYNLVSLGEVYKGIELNLKAHGNNVEKLFSVKLGGNPEDIKLTFDGAKGIRVNKNGELEVETELGTVKFSKPYAYQEIDGKRIEVEGAYTVYDKNTYGFQVASYNKGYPLIIDPVLIYSTYLGGEGYDTGLSVTVDGSGNVYLTGYTAGAFPTKNPLQPNRGKYEDAFVSKINATGSALVYSTYLGGSNHEHGAGRMGFGIAVDGAGNAYVTGGTCSTDFPTKNPIQANPAGNCDAFVLKLDAVGNMLIFSTFLGGGGTDWGYDIAVDNSGNAYVTGETGSNDFPTKNPIQINYSGGYYDAFVSKINSTGSALVYSTYLGGSDTDLGSGIAVDSSGNAYVVGRTMSTNFPIKDPIQANYGGGAYYGWDAFVAEIHASGALVYSTYLGGIYTDIGFGIAVDSSGNTYVTGETGSYNFPTKDPLQPNHGDGIKPYTDAFVTKIRPSTDPDITLAPTSHNFCSVTLMSSSAAQIFTILNAGTADLVISPISITGTNADQFSKQDDTCSNQTIAPAANCTVDVVFSPTSEGEKNANLSIPSNDPTTPTINVPLEGVGLLEGIIGYNNNNRFISFMPIITEYFYDLLMNFIYTIWIFATNKESIIAISALTLVLRIALGLHPIKSCPDIDASCSVDISDVILTLRMALGLDSLKLCAE